MVTTTMYIDFKLNEYLMGGGGLVGKGGREAEEKRWVGHTVNE